MICKLLVILLFSVTHVLAVITRHAIVFTDGKTDDILAHQVLEVRGEYNRIHFISEGVENHELVHRSIQTGRKFYRARTQAFHYNGHNVLEQAVPHEATYLTMEIDLDTAPNAIHKFKDLAQHLVMHDDHHIDIFQHAPTSADDVEAILRMFPGQVKLYHLVHGYNSSQDNESRHDPTPKTLEFVTELQSRVKFYNREALFVATAGSSSFKSPSDGVTVFMEPLKNKIPRFHQEITLKDDFYARQIKAVLDKLGQSVPPDIENSGGLQALVERARIDDGSSACLKAKSQGAKYVKDLISELVKNKMEGSVLHSRLQSSVLSAFTEGRKIEACDAMHIVHVLEQRSNPESFPDFHFVQKEKGAKIVIKHGKDKKGTEQGKTLFGLDEKDTTEKLLELFDASLRSRTRTSSGMQGSPSSAGTSSKKARQGERHLEKREDGLIRHAIVFTDGNVDDIMAHQILERRGNYNSIHFISEGVANHELAHRSIQTGRLFYRAQTPAFHYIGSNVFEEAAPHEYVFQDLEKLLRNLPGESTFKTLDCGLVTLEPTFVGYLRANLHRQLPKEETHRIDIFQHAPTPTSDIHYVLELFPGQVDRYHLVHGYNSAQDKTSRDKPTRPTTRLLSRLQMRVKHRNPYALFVAMGGSSSFNEPSDGSTVFMAPFKDLVPKFHIEANTKHLFYARQIEEAQDIVEGSAPEYVRDGFRNKLRGLFETARGSEDTPSRTAARISGKKLVEDLMGKIKDINVHGKHDGLLSRLERLDIKAFVEDCRIEAGEAMFTMHVLRNGYLERSYSRFQFVQSAPEAIFAIHPIGENQPDHGKSLFQLDKTKTSSDLEKVLKETFSTRTFYSGTYGSSSSGRPSPRRGRHGEKRFEKRELGNTRHAIVFTDGNVDDIMAHQVLERRGKYNYIHFISEGVANHELAHRSIQTARRFYGALTPAFHYYGRRRLRKAAPHESAFKNLERGPNYLPYHSSIPDLEAGLAQLPPEFLGLMRKDLRKRIGVKDRIDIFQHASTPKKHINYVLNKFPRQVDRYHLVHGHNSAQNAANPEEPMKETRKFLTTLRRKVKRNNERALFVATAGSSSFNEPSDGIRVLKAPFDNLVPPFHIQATKEDSFYAQQMEMALDILKKPVPGDIVHAYAHELQGLVETARGSVWSLSRTAARKRGKMLVEDLLKRLENKMAYHEHDGLISRLERSVLKAFVDDCRIEAGEAMHTLHVLKNGYDEDSYQKIRFRQIAENAEIMIEQVNPDELQYHGRSLFGLREDSTAEDLKQVLKESLPSQTNFDSEMYDPVFSQTSSSNRGMLQYKKRDLSKKVALALDIDGVLKHGDTVLPGAKDAIRRLVEKGIPFILLTNGGGVSEEDRAKKLSKQLEAVISPESLILGRTPMKALAQKHADDPVLVTGTNGGHSKILRDYGFQKVYTVAEVQQWNERIFPFNKLRKEQCTNSLSINGEDIVFKAFFFLQESDDWGRDMQYAIDVMSPPYGSIVAGKPKAGSAEEPLHEKDRPKLYYASADLLTPTEGISRPRLGMGAIKLSLESIYDKLFYPGTGQRLEEMTVTYGKPSKMTYEYASKVFKEEHGVEKGDYTIWMIGDNPDVDIKGANRAGWKSALVKTGVYQKNEMPTEEPTLFVDNVLEAVDKILALHPIA